MRHLTWGVLKWDAATLEAQLLYKGEVNERFGRIQPWNLQDNSGWAQKKCPVDVAYSYQCVDVLTGKHACVYVHIRNIFLVCQLKHQNNLRGLGLHSTMWPA